MNNGWHRLVLRTAAFAAAAVVFVLDSIPGFDISAAILYLAVLVLIAWIGNRRDIRVGMLVCTGLSILSWILVHASAPNLASIIRVIFSCVAIGVTGELLISRQGLQALRRDLETSRSELQHFTDSVPQILWRATPEPFVDFYNKRFTEIIGRDFQDAIMRQDWIEDFHPDDRGWFMELVHKVFAERAELRAAYRLLHADGTYRWMSIVGRPVFSGDGSLLHYYGGTSDIHDEILAREELERLKADLEESQNELQNFSDSVPQLLWRASAQGVIEYFNRRYEELTGHDREEALARQNWLDLFHPEDAKRYVDSVTHAKMSNASTFHFTFRMRHADGNYRWMAMSGRALRCPTTGDVLKWYGGTSDVHEEVLAQQKVEELAAELGQRVEERSAQLIRVEARYDSLFDVSNMTYAEMDFSATLPVLDALRARGVTDLRAYMESHPDEFAHTLSLIKTVRVNDALAQLMGYKSVAELVAHPPSRNADDAPDVLLRQLEMHWNDIDHLEGRTVLVGKDDIEVPVYFTVTRMRDHIHLSSHLNLTEQERIEGLRQAAQAELARANRVATVGAFSASIAHELNQPIASMVVDAQTGLRWLNREEPNVPAAERILVRVARTAQRVADIVQRTRDHIVAGHQVVREVDLCRLARETGDLLERDLRRLDIALETNCEDGIPVVRGYPVDIQQVLVNLINNAADAMRDQVEERRISLDIRAVEDGVAISVSDTGPGIPEADIGRLFQPFFTTKPNGIGMGLQICKTAVEAMGGDLTVRNRDAGGAEFSFVLPTMSTEERALAS